MSPNGRRRTYLPHLKSVEKRVLWRVDKGQVRDVFEVCFQVKANHGGVDCWEEKKKKKKKQFAIFHHLIIPRHPRATASVMKPTQRLAGALKRPDALPSGLSDAVRYTHTASVAPARPQRPPRRLTSKIFLKSDRQQARAILNSLEADTTSDNPYSFELYPSCLSNVTSETDLNHNVGKPHIHNFRLEAAVRMLVDNLLLYRLMDQTLNDELIHRQIAQDAKIAAQEGATANSAIPFPSSSDSSLFVYPSDTSSAKANMYADVPKDLAPFIANEELLKALSTKTLARMHMYISRFLVHRFDNSHMLYNKYLHDYIHAPGASITPYQQKHLRYKVSDIGRSEVLAPQKAVRQKKTRNASPTATSISYQTLAKRETAKMNDTLKKALASTITSSEVFSRATRILMAGTLPDLETFNILIRQFTLYHMETPARIAYDALLQSEIPLSKEIFNTVCKMAISTGDRKMFLQLAQVYDFNSVTTPDGIASPMDEAFWQRFHPLRMSSYMAHDWPECQPEDLALRHRFFQTPPADLTVQPRAMHSTHIYTTLISGFVVFGWHWWIDTAIRKMAAERLPVPIHVLTLNLAAAAVMKDAAKATWTWNQIMDLPASLANTPERDIHGNKASRVFYDEEVYLAARKAALAVGDKDMLGAIEAYNAKMNELKLKVGHLMMESPPDYLPFDLGGARGSNWSQSASKNDSSFASSITSSLFSNFYSKKPEEPAPASKKQTASPPKSTFGSLPYPYRSARNISAAMAGNGLAEWNERTGHAPGIGEDLSRDWVAEYDASRAKHQAKLKQNEKDARQEKYKQQRQPEPPVAPPPKKPILQASVVVKDSQLPTKKWYELW